MEINNNSRVQNTNTTNSNKRNSEDIDSLLRYQHALLLDTSNTSEDETNQDLVNQSDESEGIRLGQLSNTVFNNLNTSSAPLASNPSAGATGASSETSTSSFNAVETLFVSNLLFGDNFYFDYKAAGVNPNDGISSDEWAILNNNSEYVNAASQNPRKKTMTPAELSAFIDELQKPGSKASIAFDNLVNIMGKDKSGDVSLSNVTNFLRTISAKLQAGDGTVDSATNHAGTSVHGVLDRGDLSRLAGMSGSGLKIEATDFSFSPKPLIIDDFDEEKLKQINTIRDQMLNYMKPYLNNGLNDGIVKAIDDLIKDAIKNGKQRGSLDGEIIQYYPQLGDLQGSLAVYTTNFKRPPDFFKETENYFNSIMAI